MPVTEPVLVDDSIPDFITLPAVENSDWGYARTKRSVLMVPSAEWVQSVYSCPVSLNGKHFHLPNRDYPYEGLMVYIDGENWKFIDSIGLGIQRQDGSYVPLENIPSMDAVRLNPWRATYRYQTPAWAGGLPLCVSYYLNSVNSPALIGGCVEFYFPRGLEAGGESFTPVIEPFIDLRHMYGSSNFYDYWVRSDEANGAKRVHFSIHNRTLSFYFDGANLDLFSGPEQLRWCYKLGTGSRTERYCPGPATVFNAEEKDIVGWFCLRPSLAPGPVLFRLYFGCGLEEAPLAVSLEEMQALYTQSREKDRRDYQLLEQRFPCSANPLVQTAIHARIAGLTKFKTYVQLEKDRDWVKVPHAGAWWFKTPWYRDVFEGLLSSFETLMHLPGEAEGVGKVISLALSSQDPLTGRIPNRIQEYKHLESNYNASDATLLCFLAANRYVEQTRDIGFARQIMQSTEKMIAYFSRQDLKLGEAAIDGAPRLDVGSGLLLSVPQHSWMDTRSQCFEYAGKRAGGLPNRVSKAFLGNLWRRVGAEHNLGILLASPHFFLPEINAQWILMLRGTVSTAAFVLEQALDVEEAARFRALQESAGGILDRAEQHFKPVFWNLNSDYLYNAVYGDCSVRDDIESEPGLVAAAMLGESIFSIEELSAVWSRVRRDLLISRKPVLFGREWAPFGVIAKNEGPSIFYHDDQYHGDVIWLRSTPYLIHLLRILGHTAEIESLLLNTLDHQMSEGAIFYNHELLARPIGNNLWAEIATQKNPVPVKNPIQFWSQWCDAFVEFFSNEELRK